MEYCVAYHEKTMVNAPKHDDEEKTHKSVRFRELNDGNDHAGKCGASFRRAALDYEVRLLTASDGDVGELQKGLVRCFEESKDKNERRAYLIDLPSVARHETQTRQR
jgi:hypothetical protein